MLVTDERRHRHDRRRALEWEAIAAARAMLLAERPAPTRWPSCRSGPAVGQCCGGHVDGSRLRRAGAAELAELRALPRPRPTRGAARRCCCSAPAMSAARWPRRWRRCRCGCAGSTRRAGRVPGRAAAGRPRSCVDRSAAGRDRARRRRQRRLRPDPQPRARLRALRARCCERGDFAYLGLIGSATKRARFERGLRALGHPADARSARLVCPIGGTALRDKRPAVIAALGRGRDCCVALRAAAGTQTAAASRARKGRMSAPDDRRSRRCAWSFGGSPSAFPAWSPTTDVELHRRARARSTRCSARTAPARSTLVKIIYGVLHADEGEMLWDGRAGPHRRPARPRARSASAWCSSISRCSRR